MFRFESIKNFDEHIDLSIPNYCSLRNIFKAFTLEYSSAGGKVVDIGCSTGSFLSSLPKRDGVNLVGIDVVDILEDKDLDFHLCSAHEYLETATDVDVIISMFTLQFMNKRDRKKTVDLIEHHVKNGATALIAEKVLLPSRIDSVLKRQHIQAKREHFSDADILDKEADLFGSMQCVEIHQLESELVNPYKVWQSYNFVGYVSSL